ncbi:4Fe-4S ferredoxin iron-sulfur binding domain protein [Candidatus Moduliflexus flocculans]|uniref:4Fe-4S ferredoxin iron-sulfur binding domain protein n=1 Tax=Candidatus Moduliflexus flocculans TaxID=1499966 RepID=A0A081BRN1_9BACT|nr:4Fe-4S ferredoxin iron-sulfur binding domain protein [Candidatus Moduliflexus flocculans]
MLKISRILAAGIMFALCLAAFLGGDAAERLARPLLFWQFTPSLVEFLFSGALSLSLGFAAVVMFTLLFGRIYCAALCPLGILQDGLLFFAQLFRKKKRSTYYPPSRIARYVAALFTAISAIAGSFTLLTLLDPYSMFGRIVTHLVRPVFVAGNNLVVALLEHFDIYGMHLKTVVRVSPLVLVPPVIALLLLTVAVILRGRWYCNTFCPVGTLLGLISRFSLVNIRLLPAACTSCKRCERICRAGCINIAEKELDASRCVACFDCVEVCPTQAISYTRRQPDRAGAMTPAKEGVSLPRRELVFGSLSLIALSASLPLRAIAKPLLSKSSRLPITPPGSQSLERFTDLCIGCHQCVSVCPSQVIQPAHGGYGLRGVMQPEMNFDVGFCNYECHLCSQTCPTNAIAPLQLPDKQLTQIGTVNLLKDRCIVHTRHENCGACAEVCPTHAVYTQERDYVHYPETNRDLCIGCGACQYVCPVRPKAIIIDANAVHAVAKEPFYDQEPVVAPQENAAPQQKSDEFPF